MNVYVTEQLQYMWCWRLVKASISSLRTSRSFLLTASRSPGSPRATLVVTSWLPLVSDLIRPAIPGIPVALVPMLATTTPRHICQRSKATERGLKTDREGVLLKPAGVSPVLLVISHCRVAAEQQRYGAAPAARPSCRGNKIGAHGTDIDATFCKQCH